MSTGGRFVCAFRGARDRYQAAVALAEHDLLERLITDAYATPQIMSRQWLPSMLRARLAERRAEGLPADRVRALWKTTIIEHARHALGFSKRQTWLKLDGRFGEAAADEARRSRANLLIYSPYAFEAFTAQYAHTPKRVLFQYHPHPDLESRLLEEDQRRFPGFGDSLDDANDEPIADDLRHRERDSWKHADAVICSSAFTRRSLVEAGCAEQLCHVIPYGIDMPGDSAAAPAEAGFEVLFVGSGGRRKGLHHLLLAWQRASLPPGSRLTLVCRVIDRNVVTLASSMPTVQIRRGVSTAEREALYARSHLLAMPSLVEGFGQVYLEALARGCPVLGTPNTALPDLGGEADGVFLVQPGNVDQLAARLEELSRRLPPNPSIRAAAAALAARFPWTTFRRRLREAAVQ
jgi:glycosyltransferase involved in cell wall biosynthesis